MRKILFILAWVASILVSQAQVISIDSDNGFIWDINIGGTVYHPSTDYTYEKDNFFDVYLVFATTGQKTNQTVTQNLGYNSATSVTKSTSLTFNYELGKPTIEDIVVEDDAYFQLLDASSNKFRLGVTRHANYANEVVGSVSFTVKYHNNTGGLNGPVVTREITWNLRGEVAPPPTTTVYWNMPIIFLSSPSAIGYYSVYKKVGTGGWQYMSSNSSQTFTSATTVYYKIIVEVVYYSGAWVEGEINAGSASYSSDYDYQYDYGGQGDILTIEGSVNTSGKANIYFTGYIDDYGY